jgi:hypothetical protein
MSCLAVDEHNTIENDGDVEFEEVMPVVTHLSADSTKYKLM